MNGNKEMEVLTPENFSQLPTENQLAILEEYQELKKSNFSSLEVKEGLIEVISKNVEPISTLITNVSEKYIAIKEREFEFSKTMAIIAVIVVALIIVSSAVLTYFEKIDGSTFAFLLGLIVGYVLTFVKDTITPPGLKYQLINNMLRNM